MRLSGEFGSLATLVRGQASPLAAAESLPCSNPFYLSGGCTLPHSRGTCAFVSPRDSLAPCIMYGLHCAALSTHLLTRPQARTPSFNTPHPLTITLSLPEHNWIIFGACRNVAWLLSAFGVGGWLLRECKSVSGIFVCICACACVCVSVCVCV
jgi:hypothetical protein